MMEPEISRLKVQCQQLLAGVIPRLFYMHVGTEWNGERREMSQRENLVSDFPFLCFSAKQRKPD